MDLTCSASLFPDSRLGEVGGVGSLFALTASSPDLKLGAVLLYLLGLKNEVSGVITNVSVIQSWNWFFHLSAFESVLLFFIIAKIGVLEILGILPLNLTEFWEGTATGRRKRRHALAKPPPPHVAPATEEIGTKLMILYKKLDKNECGFRALCELQRKVSHDENYEKRQLSRATLLVLRSLRSYAGLDQQEAKRFNGTDGDKPENNRSGSSVDINAALEPFAEAVKIGSQYGKSPSHGCNYLYKGYSSICKYSTNVCENKYPHCPVTSDEVLEYIERIDVLLREF